MTTAVNPPFNLPLDGIRSACFEHWDLPQLVLARRTAEVDHIVQAAFDQYLSPFFPSGITVLAVGGYGRRELFPNSDIDVVWPENSIRRIPSSTKDYISVRNFGICESTSAPETPRIKQETPKSWTRRIPPACQTFMTDASVAAVTTTRGQAAAR